MYIWTCLYTGDTLVGKNPPLEGEATLYVEVDNTVDPNTHYVTPEGEVRVVPDMPTTDEFWEFRPLMGEWVSSVPEERRAQNLTRIHSEAIDYVNKECGNLRKMFITSLPGQDLIYKEKQLEGSSYLADPSPKIDEYPFIKAEVGYTGDTAEQVAQVYLNMGAQWRQIGATLETLRYNGFAAVESATTPEEILQARNLFDAEREGFLSTYAASSSQELSNGS
jgi:hypothetical protein